MFRKGFRLFVLLLLLASASGCGVWDYFFLPPPEDTALELYEAGQDAMSDKKYSDAAEYFTKLKDRYPFSPYTMQAELALGDAYYLDEEWTAAEQAYKEFESLHPRHDETPYVLYQIGMSNFKQFTTIDLPQEHVGEALQYFHSLVEQYPDSKYAAEAKERIVQCRRYMADHELFVARFYWNSGQFGPAWHRFEYVVDNFQDLSDIANYAQRMSELAYYEYQKQEAEKARESRYGSWKEWFDWL